MLGGRRGFKASLEFILFLSGYLLTSGITIPVQGGCLVFPQLAPHKLTLQEGK